MKLADKKKRAQELVERALEPCKEHGKCVWNIEDLQSNIAQAFQEVENEGITEGIKINNSTLDIVIKSLKAKLLTTENETLEKAAEVAKSCHHDELCEYCMSCCGASVAQAIRALKK